MFLFQGFSIALENFILFMVGINLLRPAAVYMSLFADHFASVKKMLITKILKSLLGGL